MTGNSTYNAAQMLMLSKVAANFFDLTIENVKRGKFYSIICHVIDVRELQQSTRYKLWYFDEKVKVKVDKIVLDFGKSIGILNYNYNNFIEKLYSFYTSVRRFIKRSWFDSAKLPKILSFHKYIYCYNTIQTYAGKTLSTMHLKL